MNMNLSLVGISSRYPLNDGQDIPNKKGFSKDTKTKVSVLINGYICIIN